MLRIWGPAIAFVLIVAIVVLINQPWKKAAKRREVRISYDELISQMKARYLSSGERLKKIGYRFGITSDEYHEEMKRNMDLLDDLFKVVTHREMV
jgi:hypothetical protein